MEDYDAAVGSEAQVTFDCGAKLYCLQVGRNRIFGTLATTAMSKYDLA